jgi:hypothetical protein
MIVEITMYLDNGDIETLVTECKKFSIIKEQFGSPKYNQTQVTIDAEIFTCVPMVKVEYKILSNTYSVLRQAEYQKEKDPLSSRSEAE